MLRCCLGNHHTNLRLYAKLFLWVSFHFTGKPLIHTSDLLQHTFMHYHNISNHTDFSYILFMRRLHSSQNMKHFLEQLINYIFIYWNTWQHKFAWFNVTDFLMPRWLTWFFFFFFLSLVSLLYVWKWWNWNQTYLAQVYYVKEGIAHFVKNLYNNKKLMVSIVSSGWVVVSWQ